MPRWIMRKLSTVIGAALLLLVLAGCIRFQADLTISADDTVSGEVIVAVIVNDDAEDGEAVAAARAVELEASLVPELSGALGVTRGEYSNDGYIGSRFELRETPLSAFADTGSAEGLTIVRSGDRITLTGSLNVSGAEEEAAADPPADDAESSDNSEASGDISVVVTFPGEVLSHDGEQSGRTVTWITEFDQPITISAESEVDSSPDLTVLWWVLGIAGLLLVVVVIVIAARRRGHETTSAATPVEPHNS